MGKPEQFKEIINADRYDQQAAQGIRYAVKDVYFLYEEYIDQGDARVYAKYVKNELPCRGVMYDAVKSKKVKAKGNNTE